MSPTGELLHTFRFDLSFTDKPLAPEKEPSNTTLVGSFSECTGLEATMEPRVIKAGGHNYGALQRVGPVTFATVVLKRGVSREGMLVRWFAKVARGAYGHRCTVRIHLNAPTGSSSLEPALTWRLERALPIKFKAADFNARATDVGIEELHLAHEGLFLEAPGEKED